IITEDLPSFMTSTASARVHGGTPWLHASLEAGRSVYLTADVDLAIEERIAAQVMWRHPVGELVLRGFVSDTELWLDKETAERSRTGGVYAGWRHGLPHDLSLLASVEVARSFYA